MSNSKDFTIGTYVVCAVIAACFILLPLSGDLWRQVAAGSDMAAALDQHNAASEVKTAGYVDMSEADAVVFHVSRFSVGIESGRQVLRVHDQEVETDFTDGKVLDLLAQKEEIKLRTDWKGRMSIIAGDNGEF